MAHHAGTPLKYQPVIEEGTYDDFKACVFRVCSSRALQVSMEEVKEECYRNKVTCEFYDYLWGYDSPAERRAPSRLVTSVQVRMVFNEPSQLSVDDFLKHLMNSHEFAVSRLCKSYAGHRIDHGFAYRDKSVEVEMEITWPYWL